MTFSRSGGAGVVATRLSAAQEHLGWSAPVLSAIDSDLRESPLALPHHTLSAAVDNYLIKKPDFPALISLKRDERSTVATIDPHTTLVHLHWINGVIEWAKPPWSPTTPLVWTLHDMNPLTGACHHSFDCEGFQTGCHNCPAVHSVFQGTVTGHFQEKKSAIDGWGNLALVSPSAWLATRARQSQILGSREISVIQNPIDPTFFDTPRSPEAQTPTKPRGPSESANSAHPSNLTSSSGKLFVLIAAHLDDPIKGVDLAVRSFTDSGIHTRGNTLALIGRGGTQYAGTPGVSLRGSLTTAQIIEVLDTAHAIVIPSLAENSPSVAYEAASRGVLPLVRNTGGLPEVVENMDDGFVFTHGEELRELFTTLADSPANLKVEQGRRQAICQRARALTHPEAVAQAYLELYESRL